MKAVVRFTLIALTVVLAAVASASLNVFGEG
jgi:hypothetical protein